MNQGRSGINIPKSMWYAATERLVSSPTWVGNGAWLIRRDLVLGGLPLPTTAEGWKEFAPKVLKDTLILDNDDKVNAVFANVPPEWSDNYKLKPTNLTITPSYTPAAPLPVANMAHCLVPEGNARADELVWLRKIWSERFLMLGFAYQAEANSPIYIVNPAKKGDVTPLAVVCPFTAMEEQLRDTSGLVYRRLLQLRLLNGDE